MVLTASAQTSEIWTKLQRLILSVAKDRGLHWQDWQNQIYDYLGSLERVLASAPYCSSKRTISICDTPKLISIPCNAIRHEKCPGNVSKDDQQNSGWSTGLWCHLMRLQAVFKRLSLANLTVNLSKSKFGHAESPFLDMLLAMAKWNQ